MCDKDRSSSSSPRRRPSKCERRSRGEEGPKQRSAPVAVKVVPSLPGNDHTSTAGRGLATRVCLLTLKCILWRHFEEPRRRDPPL
jgi:hypothetical protein